MAADPAIKIDKVTSTNNARSCECIWQLWGDCIANCLVNNIYFYRWLYLSIWLDCRHIAKHMCCWNHEILIKFKLKIRIRVAKYVHFVHCCFLQNLYCQLLVHFLQCLVYNMIPMPWSRLWTPWGSVQLLCPESTRRPTNWGSFRRGLYYRYQVRSNIFSLLSNIFCSEDMRSALRATSARCPSPPLSPLSTLCKVRAAASTNVA